MVNVYFITFGTTSEESGHKVFKKSLNRLKKEALNTGWFKDIFIYTEKELEHFNRRIHGVGAGYWWWKPNIVDMTFDKIADNDIILFLDCGFSINKDASKRFYEYVNLCNEGPGWLGFGGGPICSIKGVNDTDEWHTKRDLLIHLDCDSDKYIKTSQTGSGCFFVKKNDFGKKIISEWVELSKNIHFLDGAPSVAEEHTGFISHRNDQSILSLLVKKRLPELNDYLLDKREISENPNTDGYEYMPFRADRLDDSKLWNRIPYKIQNGKLIRKDYL